VRAQQDVATQVEAVLRVERRMVFGEVQRVEVVALSLGFGADDTGEAELFEDVADLVYELRDDVDAAAPLGPAGQREIDVGKRRGSALEIALTLFNRVLKLSLQGIRCPPDVPSSLGIERGETFENLGEGTSLSAQELSFDLLEAAFVGVRDLFETLPQRF